MKSSLSSSECNLMQVLMSAISNTLKDQPRLNPSTFMSAAASQLVGEEEEEIKNNVGIFFLLNIKFKIYINYFYILKLGNARGGVRTITERTSF